MPSRDIQSHADKAIATMRAAKAIPLAPYPGSEKPWLCICLVCGEKITPKYNNVQQGWRPCTYCGRRSQAATQRRYSDEEAQAILAEAGFAPVGGYPGSKVPWPCICLMCGRRQGVYLRRARKGVGCKSCKSRKQKL